MHKTHANTVTYEQVEELLYITFDTLKRMNSRGCFPQKYKCSLPDALPDWMGYGYNEVEVRPARPTSQEITQADAVMMFFFKLKDNRDRLILSAVASGDQWEKIRVNHKWREGKPPAIRTLQRWHEKAMGKIIRIIVSDKKHSEILTQK